MMGIIRSKDLEFEYISHSEDEEIESVIRAIAGISIDIEKGDFIVILGHNGSGKSTLAKQMNAILQPTRGSLWVNGMNTKDDGNLLNIRRLTGMVFQNPDNQIIGSIVEEDVGFGPENIGMATDEIWKRVEESLSAVDMLNYRSHSPNKLSGGQKQRVAIAGVMAMKPECIVLDEPTAMLDPIGRKDVIKTITELNKTAGVTIILITHYMEEALQADRVFVMDDGKIVMEGTPKEIFTQSQKLRALGLEVPQVTELAFELKQAGVAISDGILTIDELVEELCQLN